MRQVGKELNAHYVLLGSVRRTGDRVRITAQLVATRNAAGRWAEPYDRPYSDVFAIQDDVASKVAADLVAHAREATIRRTMRMTPLDEAEAARYAEYLRRAGLPE